MKIVLVVVLLLAVIGGGAFFYFNTAEPMLADYNRMKAGMPELDRAKAELKKFKEREAKETGWIKPAVDVLDAGLSDEIKAGKAEVAAVGTGIVINFSEEELYTPHSMTFSKNCRPLLAKLATLLAAGQVKGREIIVGNSTDAVPAIGRGRKRVPPKEARILAADRSVALAKYLEQNGVDQANLVAAAYAAKLPDNGFKIKAHKTIIVIVNPPAPAMIAVPARPKPAVKAAEKTEAQAAGAKPLKAIPIKPAQPKGQ